MSKKTFQTSGEIENIPEVSIQHEWIYIVNPMFIKYLRKSFAPAKGAEFNSCFSIRVNTPRKKLHTNTQLNEHVYESCL